MTVQKKSTHPKRYPLHYAAKRLPLFHALWLSASSSPGGATSSKGQTLARFRPDNGTRPTLLLCLFAASEDDANDEVEVRLLLMMLLCLPNGAAEAEDSPAPSSPVALVVGEKSDRPSSSAMDAPLNPVVIGLAGRAKSSQSQSVAFSSIESKRRWPGLVCRW